MPQKISFPTYFKRILSEDTLETREQTLLKCLRFLCEKHPPLTDILFDKKNILSASISIYINGKNIDSLRASKDEDIPLNPNDKIDIIPAIPGG